MEDVENVAGRLPQLSDVVEGIRHYTRLTAGLVNASLMRYWRAFYDQRPTIRAAKGDAS